MNKIILESYFNMAVRKELNIDSRDITIEDLKQVTNLDLNYGWTFLIDEDVIDMIVQCVNIQQLIIQIGKPVNLYKLTDLKKLESLSIETESKIDVSFISKLPKLTELYLSGPDCVDVEINNIWEIGQLNKLRYIWIYCIKCNDFSFLKDNQRLEMIEMCDMAYIGNLDFLNSMNNLKGLSIYDCRFDNGDFIPRLANKIEIEVKECIDKDNKYVEYSNLGDNVFSYY